MKSFRSAINAYKRRQLEDSPLDFVEEYTLPIYLKHKDDILLVGGGDLITAGDNLDDMLAITTLPDTPKIIAGTLSSISNGNYVWVRNEYSGVGSDVFRNPLHGLEREEWQNNHSSTFSDHSADPVGDAIALDESLKANVYKIGMGYTIETFDALSEPPHFI